MWEIYAYFNTESLVGLLNAAAAIHASGDYAAALAAVVFCGFLSALFAYAFAPEKLQGWQWLASVCLVYSLLILPRATVGVVDRTGNSPVQVVDNVPLGLAAFASLTSTIGHTLTQLFETTFQVLPGAGSLPAELSYQRNGLLFGNRLIRHTHHVVFPDPSVRTDVVNYLLNCTLFDLGDGHIDPGAFARSDDVWSLMGDPNPARFTTVMRAGQTDVDTCPAAYRDLSTRIPAQVGRIQGKLAFQLNPTLPPAAAAAVIAPQIQQAYLKNQLAQGASTASSLILQNAMLNAIDDAGGVASQRSNDPAAMVLGMGRAQALAQKNAAWLTQGKLAEQALPVLRNVLEALVFALFPLVVLMMMLTSGRQTLILLKGYVSLLIWIQLWPPLYAVLNYMATIYAAQDLAAAADMGGLKGLSLQTASTIYARALAGEAVVGYLTLSIPLIAWAIVQRLESLGNTLGLVSALQGAVSSSASSAASGNANLGNVSMEQQQLSPNRTSSFMQSLQSDVSGNTFSTNMLNGTSAVSVLRNQGFASRIVSVSASQQNMTEASRQVDATRSEALAAAQERSAIVSEAYSRGVSQMTSWRESKGTTRSQSDEVGERVAELDAITQNVSERTGLSRSEVARIAFNAQAKLGLTLRVKDPKPPREGYHDPDDYEHEDDAESGKSSWTFAGSGVNADASVGKTYQASLTQEEQRVMGAMSSEERGAFKQFSDRLSRDASWQDSLGGTEQQGREFANRLATATTRSQRTEAAYADRLAFSERLSASRQSNESISIDLAQSPHNLDMFMRFTSQYGRSNSALVMMDAELGRQGTSPARTFGDGSAAPAKFSDVRPRFDSDQRDAPLKRQPQVRPLEMEPLERTPSATGSNVRGEVQGNSQRIKQDGKAKQQEWVDKSKVTTDGEGTTRTQRSLLRDAAKPLVEDVKQGVGEVVDQVKKLF